VKYYLLNIKLSEHGNLVDKYIKERKCAPLFFRDTTIEDIKNKTSSFSKWGPNQRRDIELFYETFGNGINKDAIICSIGENDVYLYKQTGPLEHGEQFQDEGKLGIEKCFRVELCGQCPIKEAPLILSTIKANAWLGRGTIKEIPARGSYLGNIKAMEWIIQNKKQTVEDFQAYLYCLSSLEFETLIAKLYEDEGYHVPAYKGGFLKDFDLFVYPNENNSTPETIQIKLILESWLAKTKPDTIFWCIDTKNQEHDNKNIVDWKSIKSKLIDGKHRNATKWLLRTLYWLVPPVELQQVQS